MPGIFGSLNAPDAGSALEAAFARRWGPCEVRRNGRGTLGGHAFKASAATYEAASGAFVAVDGEWSLYRVAATALPTRLDTLAQLTEGGLELRTRCAGNVAILDAAGESLDIAVDWTGSFPLYYAEYESGFLFSSLVKPLAEIIGAARDDLDTLQFLRQAYIVGDGTVFAGVKRLLPGQCLRFRTGADPVIGEHSRAWVGSGEAEAEVAAEAAWARLETAVDRALAPSSALMMSAGWDSRTLLAAARHRQRPLQCYSHGDVQSRELQIVAGLCADSGMPCRLEPIDDASLDPDDIRTGFQRVENLVFPHWHRAGRLLASAGISCVMAGVLGEILGGHYGPTMLGSVPDRMLAFALLTVGRDAAGNGAAPAPERFHLGPISHHWYLRRDFEEAVARPVERINANIDHQLKRLRRRGIEDDARIIEAFISEHRGAQYIVAQVLSCRASTDVALPFAGGEIFALATRTPFAIKIHNGLNRMALRKHAPSLLHKPMAATLVPASAPIAVQEASRASRKLYEAGRWALQRRLPGIFGRPRLGWVDFEFLRHSANLQTLAEGLRCDIWDRESIRQRLRGLRDEPDGRLLHPVFDQFMKILTVDFLLG